MPEAPVDRDDRLMLSTPALSPAVYTPPEIVPRFAFITVSAGAATVFSVLSVARLLKAADEPQRMNFPSSPIKRCSALPPETASVTNRM